eukprot:2452936-Rhodomonas_salina.3
MLWGARAARPRREGVCVRETRQPASLCVRASERARERRRKTGKKTDRQTDRQKQAADLRRERTERSHT